MEDPEPVCAIEIVPLPLVIVMPDPAVRVARSNPSVPLFPTSSCPSVIVVPSIFFAVPPLARGRIPVTSAEARSTAEEVSLPVEEEWRRPTPYPVKMTPLFCPFLPERVTSPVVAPPKVRVCPLVVPKLPSPVRKVALFPELAEIEAVGVPPATLRRPNLALAVEVPPSSKSCVVLPA